jgi:hypothetical protein
MPDTTFTISSVVGGVLFLSTIEKWPEGVERHHGRCREHRGKIGEEKYNFG